MRIVFIICCLFLIIACEKEAKVKLPETKPLPVMCSYICPTDTLIRLKLTYSAPLYTSNQVDIFTAVPDADVRISGIQGTAQLIFNSNTQYYELQTNTYPVVPGQVYKMTVITTSGDVASAETQVPFGSIPINDVTLETIQELYGETSDRIKVSFTDEAGSVNYYRIAALYNYTYPSLIDTTTDDTRINELYSDANHDGSNTSLSSRYYMFSDSSATYSAEFYDVFLYNCSPSYYSFHKSLKNNSGDNPFAEPTLIYSNVKGGFGCFGAYTQSKFRYKKI